MNTAAYATKIHPGHRMILLDGIRLGGIVAEWSARRTRHPVDPGSSPALAASWICSRQSRAQILGHACK